MCYWFLKISSRPQQLSLTPQLSEAETVLSMNQAHIELLERDSEDFKKKLLHAESMYLRKQRFLAFKQRIKKVCIAIFGSFPFHLENENNNANKS